MTYVDTIGPTVPDDEFFASFVDLTAVSNVLDEKGRRRRKLVRRPAECKRLVWHQTSFRWEPYRELKAAGEYTGHHKINAHACFDTDGTILLIHPLFSYLWTANAFNPSCLSFEIMGNFEGQLGKGNWYKPDKFGRHRPTAIQLIRARQMTAWLCAPDFGPGDDELPKPLREWRLACQTEGAELKWVNPHRGATDDRDNDPGSEVWGQVAQWSIAEGLVAEGPLAGKGRPTPPEWRDSVAAT